MASPHSMVSVAASSLIGREDDLEHVLDLLDAGPLVTLTGSAGVGKTRLAIAAARAAAPHYRDGVVWVDLAPIADPSHLGSPLMQALGIRGHVGGEPLEQIVAAIGDRELLLALDNVEHMAPVAARVVAALLRDCPRLSLLTTSRERLDLPLESAWVVPSLAPTDAEILFVERVRAVAPDHELTATEQEAVAVICRGLDGIPLAIEFAAGRARVMPIHEIAAHIDRAIGLPGEAGGPRPRHVTLRAALDWSHDLLEEPERTLLRRLAVFSGSFTLESVESVCADDALASEEIAECLACLVDRSLVVPVGPLDPGARYRLLEITRQFARDRLEQAGEHEACERRHAGHFIALATEDVPRLRENGQLEAHRRLHSEYDNLRAVLQRAVRAGGLAPEGLELAGTLGFWWFFFSRQPEANAWLELAAGTPEPRESDAALAYGRAVVWAALHAWERGDLDPVRERYGAAVRLLDERDPWHAAWARFVRACATEIEDLESLIGWLGEAKRLYEAAGDRWGYAATVAVEGELAWALGDLDAAKVGTEEAVDIFRELGDTNSPLAVSPLHARSEVALAEGDHELAARLLLETLAGTLRFGSTWGVGYLLPAFGHLAAARGDPLGGVELMGASVEVLRRAGTLLQPHHQAHYDAVVARIRAEVGDDAFDAAWARGRGLSLDAAVALARAVSEDAQSEGEPRLSPRQWEVAELIGRGMTNRQIADELHISPHTVTTHVENIRAKLGVRSRVQVAIWVAEQRRD